MKKTFILISAVLLVVLASSFVNLALDREPPLNQNISVSAEAGKAFPTSLPEKMALGSGGEQRSNVEDLAKEQVRGLEETLEEDAWMNMPSTENRVRSEIEVFPNESILPSIVPIPDGRIFYRGEPPYGYLPTACPKQNLSLPPVSLELGS
jgi:hypothetical protein